MSWSGREDLNLRPPGPELGGRGADFVSIQSFEWCFNRLSLAESRQFGRNVNPPIATLARVSFHFADLSSQHGARVIISGSPTTTE